MHCAATVQSAALTSRESRRHGAAVCTDALRANFCSQCEADPVARCELEVTVLFEKVNIIKEFKVKFYQFSFIIIYLSQVRLLSVNPPPPNVPEIVGSEKRKKRNRQYIRLAREDQV